MEEYKQKLKKEVEDLVSFLNDYTKYDFIFDIIGKNYSFGFSNYTPTLIAVKTSEGVIEICQQIVGYRKTYCKLCNKFFEAEDFKDVENFWNEFKDSSLETTIKLVSISERDYYVIVDNNIYMDVVVTIPESGTIAGLPIFPIKKEVSNLEWVRKERERHESPIIQEVGEVKAVEGKDILKKTMKEDKIDVSYNDLMTFSIPQSLLDAVNSMSKEDIKAIATSTDKDKIKKIYRKYTKNELFCDKKQ